jgi:hypothetical protein
MFVFSPKLLQAMGTGSRPLWPLCFFIQDVPDGHHVWVVWAQVPLLNGQRALQQRPADVIAPLQSHPSRPSQGELGHTAGDKDHGDGAQACSVRAGQGPTGSGPLKGPNCQAASASPEQQLKQGQG